MIRNQRNAYQLRLHKLLRMNISQVLISLLPNSLKLLLKKLLLKDVPPPQIGEREFYEIIDAIRRYENTTHLNEKYLEEFLIHSVGLNNESLHQQPSELGDFYGKGLHLWQYPNQLASLLTNEFENFLKVNRYIEIGSRWCGTFILMSEFLYLANPELTEVIAVDIIEEPYLLSIYRKYIAENGGPILTYTNKGSEYLRDVSNPASSKTLCFIDGDHSLEAIMRDHLIALNFATIILHHDIRSDATPQVREFWNFIKKLQSPEWSFREYTNQYESVQGEFLGIGFMMKTEIDHDNS